MKRQNTGRRLNPGDEALEKQVLFESHRKSVGVAYLLWFFFGAFGAHRFYAGSTKTGVAQLVLLFSIIGIAVLIPWLIADLFLIPGVVHDQNRRLAEAIRGPELPDERAAEALPPGEAQLDSKRQAMLHDLRKTGYRKDPRDRDPLARFRE